MDGDNRLLHNRAPLCKYISKAYLDLNKTATLLRAGEYESRYLRSYTQCIARKNKSKRQVRGAKDFELKAFANIFDVSVDFLLGE